MSAYDDLNELQRRFCEAYLRTGNATQAYIDAGYQTTRRAARGNAIRLLSHAIIQDALAERRTALAHQYTVTPERVLKEWARIAFFALPDAVRWDDSSLHVIASQDLTPDIAAALAEVEMTTTEAGARVKLKAHSKVAALRALSEHLDLFGTREALDHFGQGLMGLLTRARTTPPPSNGHAPAVTPPTPDPSS